MLFYSEKGTAKLINKNINYKIAGKTGTAQVVSIAEEDYDKSKLDPSQWDHALFIAFAPKEQPEIAVALIVENGEFGSVTAAPIAKKVIETYMKRRMLSLILLEKYIKMQNSDFVRSLRDAPKKKRKLLSNSIWY